MANRLFQQVVHQMKDSIDRVIGVVDESGAVIACSELFRIGEQRENFASDLLLAGDNFVKDGWSYKSLSPHNKFEYSVFVEGEDELAQHYAALIAVSLASLKQLFDERYDKANFVKNVLIDNILPGDIYLKAKELRFVSEADRVVYLVRPADNYEVSVYDVISSLYPDKNKDFVININETDVVLVHELKQDAELKDILKAGKQISDTLTTEFYAKCFIGVGTVVGNIKDLARSYKEAQIALEIGKVFESEKAVISYENLGIGRLIYQLPTTLCDMFLSEVFKNNSLDLLDNETLFTIQKFFENNLNISETSRKLFVHRNTLVYRLEKIKKITGPDIREFDHAIIFKVALMVKQYLNSTGKKY